MKKDKSEKAMQLDAVGMFALNEATYHVRSPTIPCDHHAREATYICSG